MITRNSSMLKSFAPFKGTSGLVIDKQDQRKKTLARQCFHVPIPLRLQHDHLQMEDSPHILRLPLKG